MTYEIIKDWILSRLVLDSYADFGEPTKPTDNLGSEWAATCETESCVQGIIV